jgi:shikimate kinase
LLQTENPYQTLVELFTVRTPIYALADVQVSSDGETEIPEMVDRVIEALEQCNGIFEG